MRHPSLDSVEWQDLRQLSLSETVYNIFLKFFVSEIYLSISFIYTHPNLP